MNTNPLVELHYFPRGPRHSVPISIPLELDELMAEALRPLPRDRELPFAVDSHAIAREMTEKRHRMMTHITEHLAAKLLKVIEQGDTINGYSRDQWERLNRP